MLEDQDHATCTRNCWLIGMGVGAVAAILLLLMTSMSFLMALVSGVLVTVIAGFVLGAKLCSEDTPTTSVVAPRDLADPSAATAPSTDQSVTSRISAAASHDPVPQDATAGTPPVAGASIGETQTSSTAEPDMAAATPARESRDPVPQGATAKAPPVATTPPPTNSAPKTAVAATPAATGAKPELLDQARAEGPDDLQRIGGVGPKIEQTLNGIGIYHFDQIANWGPDDIAWVDAQLRVKGRIERDDWVAQAKAFVNGTKG
ncbi:Predicted 5' DNA nuclease, flap endonuclease-1-like, helix-3-turn-helix (H3TH) domain [Sulfitobacter brevis]|uniref:Predicted 5' DNA nuclease, flap endonuclease-1-like, helix-3-turn-helix (H3TH) domain n=1 Tax=Sulfitobacter brevis TaxID=74348 RepID=A0A1I2CCZ9_9RHOB|nr:hypothetical protein [Sulfitobacter brevis]SFE65693.1 Predicted 5' DNA nuclease, flap endonuclease-1-like, helix-3-turn-helix (H3TH) domain [Sulfitobacter brevis]